VDEALLFAKQHPQQPWFVNLWLDDTHTPFRPSDDQKADDAGGSGTIEVVFDTAGREGMQTKTVVVQSNAENNLVILRIIADITKSGN